jgi:hypothetical protein
VSIDNLFGFTVVGTLFGFTAFFVLIAVGGPFVAVSFAVIHFDEKSTNAEGCARLGVVNCGEKSTNAEGCARLGVVRGAVVAQKAREEVFPEDEVGAVVKTGITVAAQAEFVLIILRNTLFVSKLDSGSMAGTGDNTGSNCRSRSGIPVVGRSGGHRSSKVLMVARKLHRLCKAMRLNSARPRARDPLWMTSLDDLPG